MKIKVTFSAVALILSVCCIAQTKIELTHAGKHIGETVKVCGKVFNARYLESAENSPTLLDLGAAFPNQLLTLVIFGDVRKTLSYKPEEVLNNKDLCVTGKVEEYNGKPQIVITGEKNIKAFDEVVVAGFDSSKVAMPDTGRFVFTRVEKPARFPGGPEGWRAYLQRNLDAFVPIRDRAPAGLYTVKVQFVVSEEGKVSDVRAIDVPAQCPGCGREAERVIRRGPKWEPATQNGKPVIYHARQFITFQVLGK